MMLISNAGRELLQRSRFALVLLALLILPVSQALAETIDVDATCSLDQAIRSANDNSVHGGCKPGDAPDRDDPEKDGADTIILSGDIALSATPADITSIITIEGGGFTISGDGGTRKVRVLSVASSGDLTINNLTVANGSANNGGGIYNLGTVEINNSTIQNNSATGSGATNGRGGGIYNEGTLNIYNSTIQNNEASSQAGGIHTVGIVRIYNSTIRGNKANNVSFGGGGIINERLGTERPGDLKIWNSTISGNSTEGNGGGIQVYSGSAEISNSAITDNKAIHEAVSTTYGGGIIVSALAELTVNNSTIAHNTAGESGGGIATTGDLTLTHVTLSDNSAPGAAGLYLTGNVTDTGFTPKMKTRIHNSILANNNNGDCGFSNNTGHVIEQNVGNLIENPGNCGAGAVSADPRLGRLTGSPAYYPLPENSSAVDAASSVYCLREDQRGRSRRRNACDIGAFEWYPEIDYVPKAPESRVPTCSALLPEIDVTDLTGTTQCQRIDAAGVGIQSVIDRGIVDAVDVWSYMGAGTRVCFLASGSSFSFLNAATSPRTVSSLPLYIIEGKTCTFIDGPGSIVLHPGAAPAGAATSNGPAWSLSNCMVTTTDVLNFRAGPGGEVMGGVPHNATLTALSRTVGWFEVDYHGATGWISAEFVTPNGDCGQI